MNVFLEYTTFQTTMLVIWSILIVTTVILELSTTNLITVWFSVGAIAALIATVCGLNIYFQLSIFVVVTIIALIATRPLAKKIMNREVIHTNADRVIGMVGIITIAFSEDEVGQVKVDNNLWRAVNLEHQSFYEGEKVQIDAISGTKLIVSKIINHEIIDKL